MKAFFSFTAISILYCLSSISILSQTPTETDDSEVVRIDTNLIQIDATVTDKTGLAVTNLTAEDFEILQGNDQSGGSSLQSFETESSKEVRRFFESNQRAAQASRTIGVLGFVVDRL